MLTFVCVATSLAMLHAFLDVEITRLMAARWRHGALRSTEMQRYVSFVQQMRLYEDAIYSTMQQRDTDSSLFLMRRITNETTYICASLTTIVDDECFEHCTNECVCWHEQLLPQVSVYLQEG